MHYTFTLEKCQIKCLFLILYQIDRLSKPLEQQEMDSPIDRSQAELKQARNSGTSVNTLTPDVTPPP